MRLTEQGRALGLVDDARWEAFNRKRDSVSRETERLKSTWVNPALLSNERATELLGTTIEREYSLFDLLRRPGVTHSAIAALRDELSLKAKSDLIPSPSGGGPGRGVKDAATESGEKRNYPLPNPPPLGEGVKAGQKLSLKRIKPKVKLF